jgi:hypothetical protein
MGLAGFRLGDGAGETVMVIIFDGSDGRPFDLLAQKCPTAHSEGELVILTIPAFAAGFPESTADIQVRMNPRHAATLGSQLNQVATRVLREER